MVDIGFDTEFALINKMLLDMGNKTCCAVESGIVALINNDAQFADNARQLEKEVDGLFFQIEKQCLTTLARQQFTSNGINFLVGSLRIAVELERICDYANQISKIVQKKLSQQNVNSMANINSLVFQMKNDAVLMLKSALESYNTLDSTLAESIKSKDASVDKMNKDIFREIVCVVCVNPWLQEVGLDYHTAVRYIERVADRATNIAGLVYFIIHGVHMNNEL